MDNSIKETPNERPDDTQHDAVAADDKSAVTTATTDQPEGTETAGASPASISSVVDSVAANANNAARPNGPLKSTKKPWLVAGLVLLLLFGGGFGLQRLTRKPLVVATVASTPAIKLPAAVVVKATTFLESPEKISTDLAFFREPLTYFGETCAGPGCATNTVTYKSRDVHYFKIGTTAEGKAIVTATIGEGMEYQEFIAVETSPANYAILLRYTNGFNNPNEVYGQNGYAKTLQAALSANLTTDSSTSFDDLTFPAKLTYSGASLKPSYDGALSYFLANGLADIRGIYFAQSTNSAPVVTTKLASQNGKDIYSVTSRDTANFAVKEIYLVYKKVYALSYVTVDNLVTSSDNNLNADWQSGDQTAKGSYTNRPVGCGSANGFVVAKNLQLSELAVAGTAPSGQTLYDLPLASPLLKEIYTTDYGSGEGVQDKSLQNLSLTQFRDKHAVFIAKNSFGDPVVYLRSDLIVTGGCGKPVIYLYPQVPTAVNVKVGAQVMKSLPVYPAKTGWQNVLAQPSGQLKYHGKSYGSLFWEGLGYGAYPEPTSASVVPQAELISTVRAQLQAQGLNNQETNDFLDFWRAKLPSSPYVRLSWLSQDQLDILAPLAVSPRPTTSIRVFLDAQAANSPVNVLPEPDFNPPARTGFTLVEWGGLLRN